MKTPYALANSDKLEYMDAFNELYEHSPWVIEKAFESVKEDKKYEAIASFHELLSSTVFEGTFDQQESLIQAHPMLAGKKAINNELTDFSTDEQKSAGLNNCSNNEIELFNSLNEMYFKRFGFPFIMAVKDRSKEEILENFKLRLEKNLEDERVVALEQINTIGWIRLRGLYA